MVSDAPFFGVGQMDVPDERSQHAAADHAALTIREELARRANFDEHYRATVKLAVRGLGSHTSIPRGVQMELDRLAAEAAREEIRRRKYDKRHPGIYRTVAERLAAYAVLNPNTWSDRGNC